MTISHEQPVIRRGGPNDVVAHTAGTVESTTSRYLTGPGGITIAVADFFPDVHLIHRPAPTGANQ